MRLFRATAKNDQKWTSDGALDAQFYLLADDFMSAVIKADETVSELRERLDGHKGADGLRLRNVSEEGDVIDDVVMLREPQTETWIDHAARKCREGSIG